MPVVITDWKEFKEEMKWALNKCLNILYGENMYKDKRFKDNIKKTSKIYDKYFRR